jgi:hypothetical protein
MEIGGEPHGRERQVSGKVNAGKPIDGFMGEIDCALELRSGVKPQRARSSRRRGKECGHKKARWLKQRAW